MIAESTAVALDIITKNEERAEGAIATAERYEAAARALRASAARHTAIAQAWRAELARDEKGAA